MAFEEPVDEIPMTEEEVKASIGRLMTSVRPACAIWSSLYMKWIRSQGTNGEQWAFEKMIAHQQVCGCRMIGGSSE